MIDEADRSWVQSMPDAYQRFLVPTVFEPFAAELAGRVAARGPARVLELAAGTGALTEQLVTHLPGADVVATDLNPAMVALGARRVPGATWRQADAAHLPFEAAAFDAVVCQFGVMFFPDRPAAYAEACRVLAADGALLFNTWGPVAAHDFAAALVAALGNAFPDDPPGFVAAVPHGYADPDVVRADLAAAGFAQVRVDTVTLEGRARSARDVAVGFCTGSPLRAALEARGDLDAAVSAVAGTMEDILGPGPVTGRMTAHVVEASTGP
jgi:SAM-dependent methyltransferase